MNKISKPFEDDEFYKRWLVGLANRTKENYRNQFGVWQDFIKMTPTEQVNKRMNDLTTTNLNQRQFFENKFREFKEYGATWQLESFSSTNIAYTSSFVLFKKWTVA